MSLISFNYSLFWKFAKSYLICKRDVHNFLDLLLILSQENKPWYTKLGHFEGMTVFVLS